MVRLQDGSVWRQAEYHYEYRYAYMPAARVDGDVMHVDGMSKGVRVRRVYPTESHVRGEWKGWDGKTVVELDNGQVWQQEEYHCEYHYHYRPSVMIDDNQMHVEGMSKPIRVRRLR